MGPGGGKGRAALILAFGKPKGKNPDEGMMGGDGQDEEEETSKEARVTMARSMLDAMKADDAEAFKSALDDFIASS